MIKLYVQYHHVQHDIWYQCADGLGTGDRGPWSPCDALVVLCRLKDKNPDTSYRLSEKAPKILAYADKGGRFV